jgi:hypothetical protein
MAVEFHLDKEHGHPWNGEGAWELLSAVADTEAEIAAFVDKNFDEGFWNVWARGEWGGRPSVELYRPKGADRPWIDDVSPECPVLVVEWLAHGDPRWKRPQAPEAALEEGPAPSM